MLKTKIIHSSQYNNENLQNKKIAIIGSRESGVQMVQGLYQQGIKNIDWYYWSEGNTTYNTIISFIVYILPCWIWKKIRNYCHNKLMNWMVKCLGQVSIHINPLIPEKYKKYGFRYHYT